MNIRELLTETVPYNTLSFEELELYLLQESWLRRKRTGRTKEIAERIWEDLHKVYKISTIYVIANRVAIQSISSFLISWAQRDRIPWDRSIWTDCMIEKELHIGDSQIIFNSKLDHSVFLGCRYDRLYIDHQFIESKIAEIIEMLKRLRRR